MDENSYIECRKDVQENILTLYSYLQNEEEEYYYEWAKERLSQGRNFVVEAIDGKLYFAPSRFVGYKQNSLEKHENRLFAANIKEDIWDIGEYDARAYRCDINGNVKLNHSDIN